MAFEPQRGHEVVDWVFSLAKKQADYATLIADASLTNRIKGVGWSPVDIPRQFAGNGILVGNEFPTSRIETARDLRLSRSFELSSELAGHIASFGMGNLVTTGAGPFTHTIKFSAGSGSKQVPVFTLYEELWAQAALRRKYHSLAVESFTISGRAREIASLQVGLVGSGQITTGAVTVPAETAQTKFDMASAVIKWGVQAAPTTVTERLVEFSASITQGLDIGNSHYPGTGLFAGRMWYGTRRATFSALFIADTASTDMYDAWLAETVREVSFKLVNGAHSIEILFPACRPMLTLTEVDGKLAYRLEAGPEDVFKSAGGTPDEPVQIIVINNTAAYLQN